MNDDPAARGGAAPRGDAVAPGIPADVLPAPVWSPPFTALVGGVLVIALMFLATIGRSYALHQPPATLEPPPASAAIIDVPARGVSPSGIDYRRIDARLLRLVARPDMVGLGVAIIEDGKLSFLKGYGRTEGGGGGEPVTPNTVFRWASVSKGVAATLIGTLAEQKKLSLDAPLATFKTSLRLPGGGEKVATVADLLSHRTGVVKNAYDDKLEEGVDPKVIRTLLGALPPYCKPGTCFAYQNVAYDDAREIVERVAKRDYASFARSRLFLPLGMTSASLTREGLMDSSSWARPHRGQRELKVENAYYGIPAAGGMNSSIFDLGLWMRAQMGLAPGVLSQKVLDTIHDPLTLSVTTRPKGAVDRELKEASYALGWRDFRYAGRRLIGHRGAVSGYRSLILFDPERKTGIAMLWNSESPRPVGMQLELFDMLYRLPPHDWMKLDER